MNVLNDALRNIDPDVWIRTTLAEAPRDRPIIFDGIRYKRDLTYFRSAGYNIWRIDTPANLRLKRLIDRKQEFLADDEEHAGEAELSDSDFEIELHNSSSITDLHSQIEKALKLR